jgi:hypothetical protein
MKIKQITLERLVNLGNYETIRVSATAAVTMEEDSSEALLKLKNWMEGELPKICSNLFSPSRFPGFFTEPLEELEDIEDEEDEEAENLNF